MKILKRIIYHLFLSVRGLFFLVFNFVAGIFGLCTIGFFIFYFFNEKQIFFLKASGMSLGIFMLIYFIKHFYDKIIFWAKPDDIDLMLFK